MTEFSYIQSDTNRHPRNKSFHKVDVQSLRTTPFHYCPHVRDEEKGSEGFFDLPKTTQQV